MPKSARLSIVWRIPFRPASPMWLLASDTQSMPGVREALDQGRIGREDRPRRVVAEPVRGRVLEVRDREVRAADQRAHRPAVAGPLRLRDLPAERGAAGPAGDVGGPAVEREVDALAVDLDGLGDAAVEQDVAAGDERPERGRVEGRARPGGSWAVRPHSSTVFTRPTPNSVRSPQPSARTFGPTASARRNARCFGLLARLAASVAASGWRARWASSAGRSTPIAAKIASASDSTSWSVS